MFATGLSPWVGRITLSCIVLLSEFSPWSPARAQSVHQEQPDVRAALPDAVSATGRARVLVTLRDSVALKAGNAEREAGVSAAQDAVLARLPTTELTLLHRYRNFAGLAAIITRNALDLLRADPGVRSIQIDEPGGAHLLVSVPALRASFVHTQLGITGQGVTAAVLDSGIDTNDSELAVVAQQCFTHAACPPGKTNTGSNAQDDQGHGTNVAAILASSGSVYAPGFAPATKLVAVKVLDSDGRGFVSDWLAGLDWVWTNLGTLKVRVVNMSLGTDTLYGGTCDAQQPLLTTAVAQLVASNVVIFASSGNAGSSTAISAPACVTGVIAVGATYKGNVGRQPDTGTYKGAFGGEVADCFDDPTALQKITCFTNSTARVDIVAPGAPIITHGLDGFLWTFWGTSQASPTAAGVAALMLQADGTQTPAQIGARLKASGGKVTDPKNGLQFTEIDALNAVQLARPLPAVLNVNQATFAVGQPLVAGGGVTNLGLPGSADFYVGILRPDTSIQFFTGAGIVLGDLASLASFRPLATGVALATPFSVSQPSFYTHQWAAGDLHGNYVFFLLAVKAGALADGVVTSDEILGLASAAFSFP